MSFEGNDLPGEPQGTRVGYVLKMYPRLSETFIVNEILAHEAAGMDIDIFSLRAPIDGRFHEALARVKALVSYIPYEPKRVQSMWNTLRELGQIFDVQLGDYADVASANDFHQAACVAIMAKERGTTHLHAHFGSVSTTIAMIASRMSGIPFSFTAHAKDIFHESVEHADLSAKLSRAAHVVTVSDYNHGYLQDTFSRAADSVVRIYNGLDLAEFSYADPVEREPLILGVGRLVEKKGFSDLVDAMVIIRERAPELRCEIVGTGPMAGPLREQIQRLGLEDSVSLMGSRPRAEVIEHVRRASVLAAPCIVGADGNRDGLPTVLLEAMALGTPCVSTPVTGIPEAIEHGVTGLMVEPGDVQSLAEQLLRVCASAELKLSLANSARQRIVELFDIHVNTRVMRERCFAGSCAGLNGTI